jgi:hypothetical protein
MEDSRMRVPQASRLPAVGALRAAVVAGLAAVALLGAAAVTGPAAAAEGTVHVTSGAKPLPDRYLVLFRTDPATSAATYRKRTDQLAQRYSARVRYRYSSALQGFAAEMSAKQARQVAANPAVARVEQDSIVRISATQTSATWGLDRVDHLHPDGLERLGVHHRHRYPDDAQRLRRPRQDRRGHL